MRQDARTALRQLAKNPGFTVVAVLTLALAIGANTAIFSAVDGILLHPLPYTHPEQLVTIIENLTKFSLSKIPASPPEVLDYRRMVTCMSHQAGVQSQAYTVTGQGDPETVTGLRISATVFPMLDVKPIAGTVFTAEEETPGKDRVVLISEGLWKRRFGSNPNVAGMNIQLNRESYRILGVIPTILEYRQTADLYTPLAFTPGDIGPNGRGRQSIDVVGRLKPGVSLEQANAEIKTVAARIARENPNNYPAAFGYSLEVEPLADRITGNLKTPLQVLIAAVAAVMLIACANVSNLLLARAVSRRKEMSVRAALGASRIRIVRQLLTESALLAVVAGLTGLALAYGAVSLFREFGPAGLIRTPHMGINLWVTLFSVLLSLASSVIFGLAPALEASRVDLNDALKDTSRGATGGRRLLRESMVAIEVAMSLVLLIGAGLLIRSFVRLAGSDPGFRPDHVLTFQLILPPSQYSDLARRAQFERTLLDRLRVLPGVTAASAVDLLPFSGAAGGGSFNIENHPFDASMPTPIAGYRFAAPGFIETMGIPLLRGRTFAAADDFGAPLVAMVNEALVRRYFPKEDPIGLKVAGGDGKFCTIIGIVGSTKQVDLSVEPPLAIYFPALQIPSNLIGVTIRTAGEPPAMVTAARHEVAALDPNLPLARIASMEQRLADSVARQRFSIQLMTAFAAIAAVLAAIGIYGVLAYLVDQRRREIGIRMALGAGMSNVLKLVLGQGTLPVAIGLVAGIAGALGLTRLLKGLLYEVSATDPVVFVAVSGGLVLVAAVAMSAPARRATRVDPLDALRHE